MAPTAHDLIDLLGGLDLGHADLDELLPLVYEELPRVASRMLRIRSRVPTLQTTELVHEAYLRLKAQERTNWRNRHHLIGVAAMLMRRVLVDHARRRSAAKRGGGARQVRLNAEVLVDEGSSVDLEALDEALQRLDERDPQARRIVELRFFGGLTIEEAAEVLGISPATVKREWSFARAWLRRELAPR